MRSWFRRLTDNIPPASAGDVQAGFLSFTRIGSNPIPTYEKLSGGFTLLTPEIQLEKIRVAHPSGFIREEAAMALRLLQNIQTLVAEADNFVTKPTPPGPRSNTGADAPGDE